MDRFGKNAALLWSGQFVSQMGDAVFQACIAWLAASLTGSPLATGGAVFLWAVPFLLLGPLAGAWVDRTDRRRAMILSDLVRAGLLLGLPLLAAGVGLSYGLVVGAALLVAVASTPFLPARDALLPRLAEGRALVRFNAAFQTSGQLAQILGLWLGGVLLGAERETSGDRVLLVLGLDGVTFLASAATLAFLVVPPSATAPARAARGSLWRDAGEGLRSATRDPLLLGLLSLTALDNLAIMGPAVVGATLFVKDSLHLGARHLAWFEGAMALGFLVGAATLTRFGPSARKGRLILWGMTLDGLTYIPFFFVRSYPLALALIFVHGLFIPWIVVGRTALLQQHVPEERRGQVFSLVYVTVAGMTALSALAAGAIAEATDAPTLFLLAGVFGTLCGVVGFLAMPRLRSAA
ncbi:MAG TPA: MFS transporter [Planctomycetota bacterium]|jgi:MFS family permease|nr:MFS transporter [Planctomycetota bacterium]